MIAGVVDLCRHLPNHPKATWVPQPLLDSDQLLTSFEPRLGPSASSFLQSPGLLGSFSGGGVTCDRVLSSRRPSSWLPPTVSVLALVKWGAPPETSCSPEELEASEPSTLQTHT